MLPGTTPNTNDATQDQPQHQQCYTVTTQTPMMLPRNNPNTNDAPKDQFNSIQYLHPLIMTYTA
jgi:hypothetical protein